MSGSALNVGGSQAFRRALDTVPIGCWVQAGGVVMHANPCAVQLLAAESADELERHTAAEFFAPESRARFEDRVRRVLGRQTVPRSEEALITLTGRVVDVEVSSELADYAGEPAIVCAFNDITDRKRLERMFWENARRFRTLLEGDLIGVVEQDAERLLAANNVFLKMIGRSRDELEIGELTRREITPPEYAQLDSEKVEELLATGECKPYEKEYVRRDGSRVAVLLCGALVAREPNWRAIGFVIDVTDRRKLQQLRAEKLRLESVGVLAAGMAHNLNNLLTGVIGNASLLLEKPEAAANTQTRQNLKQILESGERAARLTAELLAYTGQGRFLLAATDLGELVTAEMERLRSSIPERILVTLQIAANLPIVMADPNQLQHAIGGLVMNAVEAIGAAEEGDVAIDVRVERVEENALLSPGGEVIPAGEYCVLEFRDTGCGMDQRTLAHAFDPFFSTKFTGRGLGLAAVAGIVRSLRGAIRVNSTPGAGTSVQIYLPAGAEI